MNHKIIRNKKAQESLTTDIFSTLLIVVIIALSFFVVKIWFHGKSMQIIDSEIKEVDTKRELITLLKMPVNDKEVFSDLLIKCYFEKLGEGVEDFLNNPKISAPNKMNTCDDITTFLSIVYGNECMHVYGKTNDVNIFDYYVSCVKLESSENSVHIPLPNKDTITVHMERCQCDKSKSFNPNYGGP